MNLSDVIKLILKVLILIAISILVIWLTRIWALTNNQETIANSFQNLKEHKGIIFLGSSRTQSAIDSTQFGFATINLASSDGNLFNSLCLLNALDLDSSSLVIIEMGSLKPKVNRPTRNIINDLGYNYLLIASNLDQNMSWKDKLKVNSSLLNYSFWQEISLGRELKIISGLEEPGKMIGFNEWHGDCIGCKPMFVEDQITQERMDSIPELLQSSIRISEEKKAHIYFYLPPAFHSESEKEAISKLFNSIPTKNKIVYDAGFETLLQEEYFADRLHLNQNGAQLFTEILKKSIANNLSEK